MILGLVSAEFAFKYASDNGRKKVTAVHKANIMKVRKSCIAIPLQLV